MWYFYEAGREFWNLLAYPPNQWLVCQLGCCEQLGFVQLQCKIFVWDHAVRYGPTQLFLSRHATLIPSVAWRDKNGCVRPFFLLIVSRALYLPLSSTSKWHNGGIYGGVTVAKRVVCFKMFNIRASIHTLSLIRQSTNHSWLNSPFSSSLWPLNLRSEDAFFTALASIWSNIFTNSNEKKTCLLLCLLCIFKFQTLACQNFWIFYFTSRLTLYECVVNVYIQR